MNLTIIGTGYVGLVAGLGFADFGNDVVCLDVMSEKIQMLNEGKCPIYEPGAETLLKRNMRAGRIKFTTDAKYAIEHGEIIFIAVGTPEDKNGNADLSYVYDTAKTIGLYLNNYKIIVDKSTVPIGTTKKVSKIISEELNKRNYKISFEVVSNPEFLREGKAISDFMNPDRIVLGVSSKGAEEKLKKVYNNVFKRSNKSIIVTNPETAEMIKYASNAFLATKITFINEIANLCDKVGANVLEVAHAMGTDGRISPKFLHPGPGYGGSCFPKDTKALANIAKEFDSPVTIVESVISANERQKNITAEKILSNNINLKSDMKVIIAILGLAFKPETDDIRESPALTVINKLLNNGNYEIRVYDPEAMETAKRVLPKEKLIWSRSSKEAIQGADAVAIMTEWSEFRNYDGESLSQLMPGGKVFDFRHIYDRNDIQNAGLEYIGIGF